MESHGDFTPKQKEFFNDVLTRSHASVTQVNSQLYQDIMKKFDEHTKEEIGRFDEYVKLAKENKVQIDGMAPTVEIMKNALTTVSTLQKVAIWVTAFAAGLFAWKKLS
jgi:hypothetical protein